MIYKTCEVWAIPNRKPLSPLTTIHLLAFPMKQDKRFWITIVALACYLLPVFFIGRITVGIILTENFVPMIFLYVVGPLVIISVIAYLWRNESRDFLTEVTNAVDGPAPAFCPRCGLAAVRMEGSTKLYCHKCDKLFEKGAKKERY